jgi:hypothetical protein
MLLGYHLCKGLFTYTKHKNLAERHNLSDDRKFVFRVNTP